MDLVAANDYVARHGSSQNLRARTTPQQTMTQVESFANDEYGEIVRNADDRREIVREPDDRSGQSHRTLGTCASMRARTSASATQAVPYRSSVFRTITVRSSALLTISGETLLHSHPSPRAKAPCRARAPRRGARCAVTYCAAGTWSLYLFATSGSHFPVFCENSRSGR